MIIFYTDREGGDFQVHETQLSHRDIIDDLSKARFVKGSFANDAPYDLAVTDSLPILHSIVVPKNSALTSMVRWDATNRKWQNEREIWGTVYPDALEYFKELAKP